MVAIKQDSKGIAIALLNFKHDMLIGKIRKLADAVFLNSTCLIWEHPKVWGWSSLLDLMRTQSSVEIYQANSIREAETGRASCRHTPKQDRIRAPIGLKTDPLNPLVFLKYSGRSSGA